MTLLRKIAVDIKEELRRNPMRRIYKKYREFTLLRSEDYVDNLILAKRAAGLEGCVVECGVWRGGMSAGMAQVLGPKRTYFLFDSFEGLPPAQAIDGEGALRWQSQDATRTHDNCNAKPEFAQRAMSMSGVPSFQLVQGWFEATVPKWEARPIAVLRLDGDWYDSTMICLQHFYQHVVPGGVILIDDYYLFDGCSRALHDYLSATKATERVLRRGDVCFLVKEAPHS